MALAQNLVGKVAIVTASTAGIGLAVAKRLGLQGASVVVSSRKQNSVDNAISTLQGCGVKNVVGRVCHVAKPDHRKQLVDFAVEKFGKIDILVSNAAANPHFGDIMDCPEASWDKIFDTNVKASFLLAREAVPYMEQGGNGAIVFIASIVGYVPEKMIGAYSVSKTSLLGLTKVMSDSLAPRGIRVNSVSPGFIKTDFSKTLWDTPSIAKELLERTPVGRFGEPEDIAGAVAFVVSPDAGFMTGENMIVAGGVPSRL